MRIVAPEIASQTWLGGGFLKTFQEENKELDMGRGYRSDCICFALGFGLLTVANAGTPLETETATTLRKNTFEASGAVEYQTAPEGTEVATPLAFEYGIIDNLEIMLEPTVYTAILPNTGSKATGLGDVEITLNYNFLPEKGAVPALAVAGEWKIPTAKNVNIGTGVADYAGYLIASKHLGSFTLHGNFSYTIVGQPAGATLDNLYAFSFALEQHLSQHWEWVAEVLGNDTFTTSSASLENPVTPEATGGEFFGTIGLRYLVNPNFALSLGATWDNNGAIMFAPGVTTVF